MMVKPVMISVERFVPVAGEAGLEGVGGGGGEHVDVLGEDVLKHGSGLARLHVKHHLAVAIVLMLLLDGLKIESNN